MPNNQCPSITLEKVGNLGLGHSVLDTSTNIKLTNQRKKIHDRGANDRF